MSDRAQASKATAAGTSRAQVTDCKKREIAASNEETQEMINKLGAEAQALTSTISTKSTRGAPAQSCIHTRAERWHGPGSVIHEDKPVLRVAYTSYNRQIQFPRSRGSGCAGGEDHDSLRRTYTSPHIIPRYGYYVVVDHGGRCIHTLRPQLEAEGERGTARVREARG